jgi:hypothetical protein
VMPKADPDNTFTMNTKTLYTVATLATAVIGGIWTAGGLVIATLYKDLQSAKSHSASWEQATEEAIANLKLAADAKRAREGREPFKPPPPVVPESNSPATAAQEHTGRIATMRALMARLSIDLELPPRTGEHGEGKP